MMVDALCSRGPAQRVALGVDLPSVAVNRPPQRLQPVLVGRADSCKPLDLPVIQATAFDVVAANTATSKGVTLAEGQSWAARAGASI